MGTPVSTKQKVRHPYIIRRKGICGGKPIIKGTRIKVAQIVIYYEKMNYTPDEIIEAHPHLTLAQIHDALSYYYDHREEIDRQIREERELVEEMKKEFVSVLEKKRGEAEDLCG
ncbi:MAG: DUF433 domain-containing protein [Calditrichaeota bacterium]|nr:MAG: DUF433 domain-containing protein [Calditrichota bacterium]